MQGTQCLFLGGELRSHLPCGADKRQNFLKILYNQGNAHQNHNKYQVTKNRMAIIQKMTNKHCQGYGKKGNSCALLLEMLIGTDTMDNSINSTDFPQKVKNRATI